MKSSPLPKVLLVAFSAIAVPLGALFAAEESTEPLGYTTVVCPGGSDTLVSTAGLTEKPEFVGKIGSVNVGADEISVVGATGWSDDQFNDPGGDPLKATHYVRFMTGAKAGFLFVVTDTVAATSTLKLDTGSLDLSDVVADDQIRLIKFWTLETLFPLATDTTIHNSTGDLIFQRGTAVFFPDLVGDGINLSATRVFFRSTQDLGQGPLGWREVLLEPRDGNPAGTVLPAADVVIEPDQLFIIRHAVGAADTNFVPMGHVETAPVVIPLPTLAGPGLPGTPAESGDQDTAVGLARPVDVTLINSGLTDDPDGAGPLPVPFVASANTILFNREDEVLVYDNLSVGYNKNPIKIFFYDASTGTWRDALNGNAVSDTEVLGAGTGFLIRRKADGGLTSLWRNIPNY